METIGRGEREEGEREEGRQTQPGLEEKVGKSYKMVDLLTEFCCGPAKITNRIFNSHGRNLFCLGVCTLEKVIESDGSQCYQITINVYTANTREIFLLERYEPQQEDPSFTIQQRFPCGYFDDQDDLAVCEGYSGDRFGYDFWELTLPVPILSSNYGLKVIAGRTTTEYPSYDAIRNLPDCLLKTVLTTLWYGRMLQFVTSIDDRSRSRNKNDKGLSR